MTVLRCGHIRSLLFAAVAGQASDAERLEIEAHLTDCAGCREEHAALSVVRQLRAWDPSPLSDVARQRVRNAMAIRRASPQAAPTRGLQGRWVVPAIAVALTAASLLLLLARPAPSRVTGGDVVVVEGGRGGEIHDGATLRARAGGRVVLAGPTIDLSPDTEALWHAATRTLELRRGAVLVDVEPGQGRSFQVATPRFVVAVLGTRFAVTLDHVRTDRGAVEVRRTDGTRLATVSAGQSWSVPQATTPPATAIGVASSPAPPPGPVLSVSTHPPSITAPPPALDDSSLRHRLAEARHTLSRGDSRRTRELLRPFERSSHGSLRAEAGLLIAESYLVGRQYDDAIASYQAVCRVHEGSVQAESAFLAIAQLQLERGRRDDARATLGGYLARYPQGRFVADARERLARLETPGPR